MTTTTIKVLSSSETSFQLRKSIGPLFNWENRLSDMRRGKIKNGPILLPVAKNEKAWLSRPVYLASTVKRFIAVYSVYDPDARSGVEPQIQLLETEALDRRHWRVRKLQLSKTRST